MSIHVQLERFEGPLGLLLHLIREQEMDIFNINIHHITRQYLEYIKTMRRLDLEVAGEFVAMAATLLHIKSKMLLPQYNEEGEEVSEDPRKELVQKLLEYKKFRELSADLYKRPLLNRDVFTRAAVESVESLEEGELILEDNPLFSLIACYRTALKNMKKTVHRVAGQLQSIAERIMEIKDRLVVGRRLVFSELITDSERRGNQVLVTFLSLLELAKMGFVSVFQNEPFADIHVETKRVIDRDVVSQVESYDSVNAEQTADKIMTEAQLSLSEPEPMLEGEEAPVVAAFVDEAASDEDIAAEEALLDQSPLHTSIIPHDTVQSLLPEESASDADIELELARMAAEDRGEVFVPPVAVVEEAVPVELVEEILSEALDAADTMGAAGTVVSIEPSGSVESADSGLDTRGAAGDESNLLMFADLFADFADREVENAETVNADESLSLEKAIDSRSEIETVYSGTIESVVAEESLVTEDMQASEELPGDEPLSMREELPVAEALHASEDLQASENLQATEDLEATEQSPAPEDTQVDQTSQVIEEILASDQSPTDAILATEPEQPLVPEMNQSSENDSLSSAENRGAAIESEVSSDTREVTEAPVAIEPTPAPAPTSAPAEAAPKNTVHIDPRVNSALNAALSAFDAFNEISPKNEASETGDPEDRPKNPPEVEA